MSILAWSPHLLPVTVLVYACVAATWSDLRSRLVPNRICYGALLFGVMYYAASTLINWLGIAALPAAVFVEGLPQAIAGTLVCGLALYPFWSRGDIGGGDLKFAAVIGMFLGPVSGLTTICLGTILALLFLPVRAAYLRLRQHGAEPVTNAAVKNVEPFELPMACFFSLGVAFVVFQNYVTR